MDLFDALVRFTTEGVPEVVAASVTLVKDRAGALPARLAGPGVMSSVRGPVAFAGPAAILAAERLQSGKDSGPCVQSLRTGEEVRSPVPAAQWPDLSVIAGQRAVRACWSLPLLVGEQVAGSFSLYSTEASPWDGPSAGLVALLAAHAAALLGAADTQAELEHANATLRQALETRTVIGQAQGVLMVRQGVTPDGAFDILRRASQRTNRKLREVAADLVQGVIDHAAGRPHTDHL